MHAFLHTEGHIYIYIYITRIYTYINIYQIIYVMLLDTMNKHSLYDVLKLSHKVNIDKKFYTNSSIKFT